MNPSLILRIPATTANLGPGFDLFGLALSLYNTIGFDFDAGADFRLVDTEGRDLPIAPEDNLIRTAYEHMYRKLGGGKAPAWNAVVDAATAPGKGFGSSAMAVVAGVHLAWAMLRSGGIDSLVSSVEEGFRPETHSDEIAGFLDLEPHPDNVVPARVGGWVFCSDTRTVLRHSLPDSLGLAILIPDYSISTEKSRQSLPLQISREDTLANMRGCLLWLEYIHSGRIDLLEQALASDRLHEPYRTPSLPGYQAMKQAVLREGCVGMTLSGSGPGIIVYFDRTRQEQLESRLRALALEHIGPATIVHFCTPDPDGLVYLKAMPGATAPLQA
ncbi:homoserine kinase [Leptonema illini]|uniref:Homoserine kinase n=1 Tax=Leptonema illini DSM 21528 TaxID=929563 RepID=H2CGB4_9LEPT|nr:homoserine kinase [Leptonema illini]EHQ06829.1 homoserine kinase [Leptonema illini DSM 21528]